MKKLRDKVINFTGRDISPELRQVVKIITNHEEVNMPAGVTGMVPTPEFELSIEIEDRQLPDSLPWYFDRRQKDGDEVYYLQKRWLKENIYDPEYDCCFAIFDDKQWRTKELNNSIGGTAEASPINGVGIVYMTATEDQMVNLTSSVTVQELIKRYIHERCHVVFDDHMGRPDLDVTHEYDYKKDNLLGAVALWDLSNYKTAYERENDKLLYIKQLATQAISLLRQLLTGNTKGNEPIKVSGAKPRTLLEEWAFAIKEFEGWYPGSRSYRNNNPGNLRWSKYQSATEDGFAVFSSYEEGWKGLLYQLRIAADGRSGVYDPEMTLFNPNFVSDEETPYELPGFFQVYAPSSDNNHPENYAKFVADRLDISPSTKIKTLV